MADDRPESIPEKRRRLQAEGKAAHAAYDNASTRALPLSPNAPVATRPLGRLKELQGAVASADAALKAFSEEHGVGPVDSN
jgi:hypothetical protein